MVSVPLWGLFNLMLGVVMWILVGYWLDVSVPLWGLFNLTGGIFNA